MPITIVFNDLRVWTCPLLSLQRQERKGKLNRWASKLAWAESSEEWVTLPMFCFCWSVHPNLFPFHSTPVCHHWSLVFHSGMRPSWLWARVKQLDWRLNRSGPMEGRVSLKTSILFFGWVGARRVNMRLCSAEFSHQTFQLVSSVWLKLIWLSVLIMCLQSFASTAVPSLTPTLPEFHPMQSWFSRSSSWLWINCPASARMRFILRTEGEKRINGLVVKIQVKMIFGLHCSVSTLSHHVTGNDDQLLQCLMFWPKCGGLSIMYIWDTLKPYSLYFSFSFACKCKINLFQRLKYGIVFCFSCHQALPIILQAHIRWMSLNLQSTQRKTLISHYIQIILYLKRFVHLLGVNVPQAKILTAFI